MRLLDRMGWLFASKSNSPKKASASMMYNDFALDKIFASLSNLPDPDAMLKKAGIRRERLRLMEYDDEITAALETRREAAISTPWRLEPSVGEATEFVTEQIMQHSDSIMRGLWNAIPYGYSVVEIVYAKLEGGRVGLARCEEKPFEWFEPRQDGTLIYRPTDGSAETTVDTDFKFVLARRNPTYRNPYGEALLSRIYWPWQFRHNAWRFWMQFLERFGDPLLLGKSNDPAKMVEELQKLGVQSILAVGSNDELSAVAQAGSGEFERVEGALARRIQKVILGQTLTSDIGDSGSYAAAKVHDQVRQEKRQADIRLLQASMQRIVDALWRINNFGEEIPKFVLADVAGLEKDRAERDATLVGAGIVQLTEDYILRVYDYDRGDIIIPKPGAKPKVEPDAGDGKTAAALSVATGKGQAALDGLASEAINLSPDTPIPIEDIRRAVLAAKDPEDLKARLAKLLDEQTPDFAEILARASFAAEVLGYINASEGR